MGKQSRRDSCHATRLSGRGLPASLFERAGLSEERITFHDLRHTCASLLFQKNIHPKFVQELLGHASVAITLDTYSHMLPGMGGETSDAMYKILS